MKLAHNITLDADKGVFIDGIKFPYYVGVDAEVEVVENMVVVAKLPVFADSVTIVRDSERTYVDKDGDMGEWIRQKGREIYGDLYPPSAEVCPCGNLDCGEADHLFWPRG